MVLGFVAAILVTGSWTAALWFGLVGGYLFALLTGGIVSSLGNRSASATAGKERLDRLADAELRFVSPTSAHVAEQGATIVDLEPELDREEQRLTHAASVEMVTGAGEKHDDGERLHDPYERVLTRHPDDPRFQRFLEDEEAWGDVRRMQDERRAAQEDKKPSRRPAR
jgi:hypothetical protein